MYDDGTKWIYSAPGFYDTETSASEIPLVSIQIDGDSTINDTIVQRLIIQSLKYETELSEEFIHSTSDQVYLYDQRNNKFILLYDFALELNNSIELISNLPTHDIPYAGSITHFNYEITSVDELIIDNNTTLKTFAIQDSEDLYIENFFNYGGDQSSNTIIEKIGSENYYFGLEVQGILAWGWLHIGDLKCFQDDNISYKSNGWTEDCKTVQSTNQTYSTRKSSFLSYPNPADTKIIIPNLELNQTYLIKDILGNAVLEGSSLKINVSTLPSGTYFLSILENGTMLAVKKIQIK